MVGIWFKKNLSLLGPAKRRETPPVHLFDLKTPENIRPFESDMPTTFFLEPRPYVFFVEKRFGRKQRINRAAGNRVFTDCQGRGSNPRRRAFLRTLRDPTGAGPARSDRNRRDIV